jgi:N-acyl-D-amino-acid deacylase
MVCLLPRYLIAINQSGKNIYRGWWELQVLSGHEWNSMSEYFDAIDRVKPSVNISSYVGFGAIRLQVMGMQDCPASAKEIEAMQEVAEQAMLEGARGISVGLIYLPSSYQSMDEMVSIAKTVACYDGIYDVHMRNETDFIDQAIFVDWKITI